MSTEFAAPSVRPAGDKNYPWKTRMKNTHDVPLPDGTEDEAYLGLLRQWLPRLVEQHRPQLMLFQAGVDALHGDRWALSYWVRGQMGLALLLGELG